MTNDNTPRAQQVRVTFLNCFDATFLSAEVSVSQNDEARLAALLSWLQEAGVLLLPRPSGTGGGATLLGVLSHLRAGVGAHIVEAALAAEVAPHHADRGAPVAVMPVWPFEPAAKRAEDRDVLLSSGRLWGADVLIEALRVSDPDDPAPVTSVQKRLDHWVAAAGGGHARAAVQPPGEAGWYVLAAMAAPK